MFLTRVSRRHMGHGLAGVALEALGEVRGARFDLLRARELARIDGALEDLQAYELLLEGLDAPGQLGAGHWGGGQQQQQQQHWQGGGGGLQQQWQGQGRRFNSNTTTPPRRRMDDIDN